ncbi:MAG: hypothetical protein A2612_01530 [Candidatus Moranbacteria bacterium RIFOXYD1_FULL_44_12]|nr:MAG: hypothetical protein A2612_01530 [Candidatus Moranbacteria bacterium RIFOXYD1_FULL_44_12]OGK67154.1 MAG: hypothetical protein A2377_00770 [Candidatus Roizmanbacteria bacterium RIFOXYB1_FULL_41_27]
MKILAVNTWYRKKDGKFTQSSVDWWRIVNPLSQLTKRTDIQVDFVKKLSAGDIAKEELEWDKIGENYDIIYTSYIYSKKFYAWIKALQAKYGTTHIMDMDDNVFEVDEMNPSYLTIAPGTQIYNTVMTILKDADNVTTSTEFLANKIGTIRQKPVYVAPNRIDTSLYKYDSRLVPNNGNKIIIGYQGSSTHHSDVFRTGFIWAIRRLMKRYPNVYLALCGGTLDLPTKHLPKNRIISIEGSSDFYKWIDIWGKLPFDIGVAPLVHSSFNRGKSGIKYFEYALRRIPGVYSFWQPYWPVVKENETGFLAQDEEEWFEKLSWLIENKPLRKKIADNAYKDVINNYTVQKNYKIWEKIVRQVRP